jgi:hypothetical protein
MSAAYFTGDWYFATLSIQSFSAFKDSRHQHLNTERSEVLEPHEMGVERRQALEYRTAAIEHRTQ